MKIDEMLKTKRKAHLEKEDKDRTKVENTLEEMYANGGLWRDSDVAPRLKGLKTKTKQLRALKNQINIQTKTLKVVPTGPKVLLGKASVAELEGHLHELIATPVAVDLTDICDVILDPSSLVGAHFSQKWSADGAVTWCDGTVEERVGGAGSDAEFRLKYGEDEVIFMTSSELIMLIADIIRGDLDIV